MKTLRITRLEMRNLEIPDVWSVAVDSYFEYWIEEKLKEAGFDLTKKCISYKDFLTLDLIFEQGENNE